jgi:hypothetical protein
VGLTDVVPPIAASVTLVPSVPVRVTSVALLATTVSKEALPEAMLVGFAVRVRRGAAIVVTVTVAVAVVVPPGPVAVAV